jgi:predicted N-acetyltransferase YhbS
MRIEPLADHPHLAPILARWHGAEWADLIPEWGPEAALAELLTHTNRDTIPITMVALDGDRLLGSVSLIVEDLAGWEHLTPWLASVFVAPDARSGGIGTALVTHATQLAARLGVSRLHLFTEGQLAFYERLGWHAFGNATSQSHPVTIMALDLTP